MITNLFSEHTRKSFITRTIFFRFVEETRWKICNSTKTEDTWLYINKKFNNNRKENWKFQLFCFSTIIHQTNVRLYSKSVVVNQPSIQTKQLILLTLKNNPDFFPLVFSVVKTVTRSIKEGKIDTISNMDMIQSQIFQLCRARWRISTCILTRRTKPIESENQTIIRWMQPIIIKKPVQWSRHCLKALVRKKSEGNLSLL